ncbi:MAG: hypothetical protein HC836_27740 [Richelia sp. RM2_1_2]|nr:hypothetical protein [Richelia sp. RM2_1_2]
MPNELVNESKYKNSPYKYRSLSEPARASAISIHPFKIFISSLNEGNEIKTAIQIYENSFLLKDFNDINNFLHIINLGRIVEVEKNSKIYLEIIFNERLLPILSIIRVKDQWDSNIYPNLIKFVKKPIIMMKLTILRLMLMKY